MQFQILGTMRGTALLAVITIQTDRHKSGLQQAWQVCHWKAATNVNGVLCHDKSKSMQFVHSLLTGTADLEQHVPLHLAAFDPESPQMAGLGQKQQLTSALLGCPLVPAAQSC